MISRPWLVLPANVLVAVLAAWVARSVDDQPSPALFVGATAAVLAAVGTAAGSAASRISLSSVGVLSAAVPLLAQLPIDDRWRALAWSSSAMVPGVVTLDVALRRRRHVGVALIVVGVSVVWLVTRVLFIDSYRRVDCGVYCRPNPLLLQHRPALATGAAIAVGLSAATWGALAARGSRRRDVVVCGAVVLSSWCVVVNGDWLAVLQPRSLVVRSTLVLAMSALAIVVIDGADRDTRQALLRRRVRQLSDTLGIDDTRGLQGRLRAAAHDPGLRLLYPLHDGRLIDAEGVECEADEVLSSALRLTRRDQEVALLVTDAGPGMVAALSSHLLVAIENEGLLLRSQALLDELQRSRQRLVASADETRHQLERDLHDGAQQRLLAVAMLLTEDRGGDTTSRATALVEATSALTELRRIARGLYPVSLDRLGLVPALQTYLDESPVAMGLRLEGVEERMSPEMERVVFRIVRTYVETAGQAGALTADVSVARRDGCIVVDLEHDGSSVGDLIDIEDRVGAVGGTWRATPQPSGHRATAVLPCA
jgi:signal transduction histidine kinase